MNTVSKNARVYTHVTHEAFNAEWNADSEILILGSIPSPKSREQRFYYGHPRNRFWDVLSLALSEPKPDHSDIEGKRNLLRKHRIALWDVLSECDIIGASDGTIKNPIPTDISGLIKMTSIKKIFCTGQTAHKLYEKLQYPLTGIHAIRLPSTSPANCAFSLEKLVNAYSVILR